MPFIFGGFSCCESNSLTKSKKDKDNGTSASGSETMANKELDHVADVSDFQSNVQKDGDPKGNTYDLNSLNQNGSCESFSREMLQEHIVGELSEESCPYKEITWKIPNFFAFTEEIDFLICSPVFSLANSTWYLQMFVNGQKKENSDGWIDLLLVRLFPHDSNHLVWYKLGIKTGNGEVYESFDDFSIFSGKDVAWGVSNLIKRSSTVDDEELIAKDGIVIAFCEIQVSERKTSVCTELPQSLISSPLHKTLDRLTVGELSEELFSTLDISWQIPYALKLLEDRSCQIVSPVFNFENGTLQMYLTEEEKGKKDARFGLKLVRSSILRNELFFTLGIKNCFGNICNSFSGKYIFGEKPVKWKNVCFLEQSTAEKSIITNGCITAICRLYSKITTVESPESPLKSQSDEKTRVQLYSELNNSEFTWEITNFFQLPVNEGYFIESEKFSFANVIWCLRMYPNGKKGHHKGWIHLLLVRLNSYNLAHQIHYRLGLKTRNDGKQGSLTHATTFYANAAAAGFVNLEERSEVFRRIKQFAPKNILTVFCEIFMIKEVTVPLSNHTLLKLPSEIQSFEILEHAQQLRLQSALSNPVVYMWKINNFAELPMDDGFFIDSAKFSLANATYCMRMYPNGQNGHKGWIQLFLVRLYASNSEHRIQCILGILKRKNKEHSSLMHDVTFNANAVEMGVINLLRRLESNSKSFLINGTLTAFCHIYKMEKVVLSNNAFAVKQFEPSSKFKSKKTVESSLQLCPQVALSTEEILTWEITNFNKLPMDEGYFINSSKFSFANATWCLRMYPNGKKGDHSGWVHLLLVRLQSYNTEHRIHYNLALKIQGGDLHKTLTHMVTFNASVREIGIVNLVKRSGVIYGLKKFTQNDFLTAFCQIFLIEVVTSNSTLVSQPSSELKQEELSKFSEKLSFSNALACQYFFSWEITNFFDLPMDEGYFTESEEFSIANTTWCLRMYPNGQKGDNRGWIGLSLVRLQSCSSQQHIQYRLGFNMLGSSEKYETLTHVVTVHANSEEVGVVNLLERSDVMSRSEKLMQKDILTAFCQIWVIEDFLVTSNKVEQFVSPSISEIPLVKNPDNLIVGVGVLEKHSFLDAKDVIWKIPSIFIEPMEVSHQKESPIFSFLNERWYLRIHVKAAKNGKIDRRIKMYLVRFKTCSLMYVITYELSILDSFGSWRKFNTNNCKGIFQDSSIKLGSSKLHFASDGFVTIYFQMLSKEELTEASMLTERPKKKIELPLNYIEQWRYGELHEQPFLAVKEVIWEIQDFFMLKKEVEDNVNSPVFDFAGDTWWLQLYPNGYEKTAGEISFVLVRLFPFTLRCHVICHFSIKNSVDINNRCKLKRVILSESTKSDPAHLKQSEIMEKPDEYVPKGILTVLCRMYMIQDSEEHLQPKQPQPVTRKDLCKEAMVDLKENTNNASFSEGFNSNSQEMVLKDKVNILAGEIVVDKDFSLLKKKKKKKNTNPVKNRTPLFGEIKTNTQEMGSKDGGYCIEDGKVVDVTFGDVDLNILKEEKKSNSQLIVEYPIEKNRDVAKLERDADHVMNTAIDLKQDNSTLFEELKNNTQKTDQKDEGNVITRGRVVDELDLTVLKEQGVKSDLCEVEYCLLEKKIKEKIAINKIQQDYREVPCCNKDYDVRFFVKGKEFREHSAIFKDQSTYFAPLLEHKGTKGSSVVVIDHSDPQIFKVFLQYLYSGHVALTSKNVFSLCSIADKYGVQKLRTECLQFMKSTLSADTICDFVVFSLQQEETELIEFAADFMSRNVIEISVTLKWQMFLKENYSSAKLLLKKMLERHTNFL